MNAERFIQCNDMALKIFGCEDRLDIIDHSPWEFSPPRQPDGKEPKDKAIEVIQAAIKGAPQRFYWKHCRKDGSLFDAEVSLNSVQSGKEMFIQALVIDISERRRAEMQLHLSEAKFSGLFHSSPDAILLTELKSGRIVEVNTTFEKYSRFTR